MVESKLLILFLHIPKTAGTTLRWLSQRNYDASSMLEYKWWFHYAYVPIDEFRALPQTRRDSLAFVAGHMSFGLHKAIARPSTYITVVREPVSRVISEFYHTIRAPKHPLHNQVVEMSLYDYLLSGLALDVDNGQTRRLSGVGADVSYGRCSTEMLEQAQHNLRSHFSLVGLTERFDETVLLLKYALGWSPYYLVQNRGRNRPLRPDLSQEVVEIIREHNRLDIQLYQYAQELFGAHIARLGPGFKRELDRFRFLNGWPYKTYMFPYRVIAKIRWVRKKGLRRRPRVR